MPLPRLGFLGTGWIGKHRMEALFNSGKAEIAAIADKSPENAMAAARAVPTAEIVPSFDHLLDMQLDGLVIATPSACHSSQAIKALAQGIAVFCQKPLGRNTMETKMVVNAAQKADRLIGVDFSYRYTEGFQKIRELVRQGELGDLYAADMVFHNAYGPDKAWFYDAKVSGGGCLIDLGIHLMDLALWIFDFPVVTKVTSSLFHKGRCLKKTDRDVEDYAVACLTLENGGVIRIACSWNLPAGQDAVIGANLFGTRGGAGFRNINGSFYDFIAERFNGTSRELLTAPPENWGGQAAIAWVQQLNNGGGFNPEAEKLIDVATVLDAAYGR